MMTMNYTLPIGITMQKPIVKTKKGNKGILILAQIAFWTFFTILIGAIVAQFITWDKVGLFLAVTLFFGAIAFYTNWLTLVPKLLLKEKYGLYVLGVAAIALVLQFGRSELLDQLVGPPPNKRLTPLLRFLAEYSQLIFLCLISTSFRLYQQYLRDQHTRAQLETLKIESELLFLKSQINPHFLFNTLNNIYSLAYRKDERAAEMVGKLSNIMRYMLYECSKERVKVDQELEMLKDFIEMNHIKAGTKLNVDFYTEGIAPNLEISPMLLINFVENAFKHSDIESAENAWIHLSATAAEGVFTFTVENSRRVEVKKNEKGIGLENTRRQLELNYPNRHRLKLLSEKQSFKVELEVDL